MMKLLSVSADYKSTFTKWFQGDEEGVKRLSSYADFDSWLTLLNENTRYGWVIEINNKPIGFIDLEIDNKKGYFSFYISPEERGKGLAQQAIKLMDSEAKNKNISYLVGTAEEDNLGSQKTLINAGFEQDGRDKDQFLIFKKKI